MQKFDMEGGAPAFARLMRQLLERAASSKGGDLRGYVLGAPLYETLYRTNDALGTGHTPFVALTKPVLGPDPTSGQTSAHTFANAAFEKQQEGMRELKNEFTGVIDSATYNKLARKLDGLASVPLSTIVADMYAEYGTVHSNDLATAARALDVPYVDSQSFREYLAGLHANFIFLQENNSTVAETKKVQTLIDGVQDSSKFAEAVRMYLLMNTTVAERTYDRLTKLLVNVDREYNAKATVGGGALANAARFGNSPASAATYDRSPAQSSPNKLTSAQEAEVQKLIRSFAFVKTNKADLNTQEFPKYCYHHGPSTSHRSDECNERFQPGFQTAATMQNKMGGRTEPWGKGDKKGERGKK